MTIVDRYILAQFFKIFLVCFISMAGLFVVIHVFTNLDEVIEIAGTRIGIQNLAFDFYGPRVLDFFNRMAGVLILVAAVFAISMMQRRQETTATEAAGITKGRLIRPVILAALLVIVAAIICRELYIPKYKSTLVRSLTNWTSAGAVPMNYQKDFATGILIQGEELVISENRITKVQLKLPPQISPNFLEVQAENGIVTEPTDTLPAGLKLLDIDVSKSFANTKNIMVNDQIVVYTPCDNAWLEPDQLFVVCNLDVQELAYGNQLARFSSLSEMIESLKKPGRRFSLADQVSIHQRILKPIVEFTLVLIGLPLVICNPNRNIFVAAALCTLIVVGIEMTSLASHAMGSYRLIRPAALAAWLPVIIFLPFSAFSVRKLFD